MINILILSAGTRDKVVQYFKEALAGKGKVIIFRKLVNNRIYKTICIFSYVKPFFLL